MAGIKAKGPLAKLRARTSIASPPCWTLVQERIAVLQASSSCSYCFLRCSAAGHPRMTHELPSTGSAARAAPCGRRTTAAAQPQTRRRPRQQRYAHDAEARDGADKPEKLDDALVGLLLPITIPGDRDPRLRHLLAGTAQQARRPSTQSPKHLAAQPVASLRQRDMASRSGRADTLGGREGDLITPQEPIHLY